MTRFRPDAIFLLNQLLTKAESRLAEQGKRSLRLTAANAPRYCAALSVDEEDAFTETLRAAEAAGGIAITTDKRSGRLDAVRVADSTLLAAFLGRRLAAETSAALAKRLEESLGGELAKQVLSFWRRGKAWEGATTDDVETLVRLAPAARHALNTRSHGLSLRSFSARHAGDSKIIESNQALFCAIAKRLCASSELDGLTAKETMAFLELASEAPLVQVRGAIVLCGADFTAVRPYHGIHPQSFAGPDAIAVSKTPTAVLTIENHDCFVSHCALEDGTICIYTGGNPSRSVCALIKRLDAILPHGVPFLHWGDLDAGGVRIFRRIDSLVCRSVKPHHLMGPRFVRLYGNTTKQVHWEKVVPESLRESIELAAASGFWLEQERVPAEPIDYS